MIYQAILTRPGERMTISLGECQDTVRACDIASKRCPKGWEVFDVHPATGENPLSHHFRTLGSSGGRTTGPTKARSREAMQAAANKRWAKSRALS